MFVKTKGRKNSKRSKQSNQEETYLCPPTEVPTGSIENAGRREREREGGRLIKLGVLWGRD